MLHVETLVGKPRQTFTGNLSFIDVFQEISFRDIFQERYLSEMSFRRDIFQRCLSLKDTEISFGDIFQERYRPIFPFQKCTQHWLPILLARGVGLLYLRGGQDGGRARYMAPFIYPLQFANPTVHNATSLFLPARLVSV